MKYNPNAHVVHHKNQQRAKALAVKIAQQVRSGMDKGLNAVRPFLVGRIKETLSEPAPRKRSVSALGNIVYRATTSATQGAPPRKLSGRLRASVSGLIVGGNVLVIGVKARGAPTRKYPAGFNYPKYHEIKRAGMPGSGQHQFVVPTFRKWRSAISALMGREIKLSVQMR